MSIILQLFLFSLKLLEKGSRGNNKMYMPDFIHVEKAWNILFKSCKCVEVSEWFSICAGCTSCNYNIQLGKEKYLTLIPYIVLEYFSQSAVRSLSNPIHFLDRMPSAARAAPITWGGKSWRPHIALGHRAKSIAGDSWQAESRHSLIRHLFSINSVVYISSRQGLQEYSHDNICAVSFSGIWICPGSRVGLNTDYIYRLLYSGLSNICLEIRLWYPTDNYKSFEVAMLIWDRHPGLSTSRDDRYPIFG